MDLFISQLNSSTMAMEWQKLHQPSLYYPFEATPPAPPTLNCEVERSSQASPRLPPGPTATLSRKLACCVRGSSRVPGVTNWTTSRWRSWEPDALQQVAKRENSTTQKLFSGLLLAGLQREQTQVHLKERVTTQDSSYLFLGAYIVTDTVLTA